MSDLPQSPLVSVLIPTFNRAQFILEAIESAQSQDYTNIEILVQDDGSADATPDLVHEIARRRDSRIKVERWQENRGVAAARNRLIERARGELVTFLDSDDGMMPSKLSKQVRFLRDHPQIAAVGTACIYVEADGRTEIARVQYPQDYSLLRHVPHYCSASILYRCEALRSAFPIRSALVTGEDIDLILRVSERWPVTNMPDYLYRRRRHASQISRGNDSGHVIAMASSLCRQAGAPDCIGAQPHLDPVYFDKIARDVAALYLSRSAKGNRHQQLAAVLVVLHAARRAGRLSTVLWAVARCLLYAPRGVADALMLWAGPERAALR